MTRKMTDAIERRNAEIKGGKITPFSGKRETLKKFLETIGLHLILNRVKEDEDKIAFVLTYLEGGEADSWRTVFLRKSVTAKGEPNFGRWDNFLQDLRESFKPYDKEGDAFDEIIKMRQGNATIEDHVAKFKVLLADSGVAEDSPAALDYFQKLIQIPLLKKILDRDNVPETLLEWYKKALKVDNDYHKVQRIIKRDTPKKEEGRPRWNFRKDKDENAMDVDVITKVYRTMTEEERKELMRKGCASGAKRKAASVTTALRRRGELPPPSRPSLLPLQLLPRLRK